MLPGNLTQDFAGLIPLAPVVPEIWIEMVDGLNKWNYCMSQGCKDLTLSLPKKMEQAITRSMSIEPIAQVTPLVRNIPRLRGKHGDGFCRMPSFLAFQGSISGRYSYVTKHFRGRLHLFTTLFSVLGFLPVTSSINASVVFYRY
jgi:hypothetical protein